MNRGRGRQIALLAIGGVALVVLGILVVGHLGETQAYADAAASATQIEREHFEGYFLCALPGATASQLSSASRVQSMFERAGDRLGKGYGATLSNCASRLQELSAQVSQLSVPQELRPQHQALQAAVEQLQSAVTAYAHYLEDDSAPYDFAAAVGLIEKVGLAFDAYRDADDALIEQAQARM